MSKNPKANKIDRPEVYIDLAKDNFVLTRLEDNKQIPGAVIKYIEWNEDGTFKASHDSPAVNRSIIVDPGPWGTFRWMTSAITEIIKENEFKTQNSTYVLHKV